MKMRKFSLFLCVGIFAFALGACGGRDKEWAPIIENVHISPSTIDISSADQVVTMTIRVSDDDGDLAFLRDEMDGFEPNTIELDFPVGTYRQTQIIDWTFPTGLPISSGDYSWILQLEDKRGHLSRPYEVTLTIVNSNASISGQALGKSEKRIGSVRILEE